MKNFSMLSFLVGALVLGACTITTTDRDDDDDDDGDATTAATTGTQSAGPGSTGASASNVPAEIVGDWIYGGAESAQSHTIHADGTWSGISILDPSQCISFDKIDIRREGVAGAASNVITFSPTRATVTTTGCSAGVEVKPGSLDPLAYDYVLGVEGGVATLTLTDRSDPTIVLTYEKQ